MTDEDLKNYDVVPAVKFRQPRDSLVVGNNNKINVLSAATHTQLLVRRLAASENALEALRSELNEERKCQANQNNNVLKALTSLRQSIDESFRNVTDAFAKSVVDSQERQKQQQQQLRLLQQEKDSEHASIDASDNDSTSGDVLVNQKKRGRPTKQSNKSPKKVAKHR